MATWVWVVIAIAVVVVVALGAVAARNRRTSMLRDRFGPEYDRAIEKSDDRRAAEADLLAREKQRAQFDVKPLPEATRLRFAGEWDDLQELFVDEPAQAADGADALITRVMETRGYPMRDFDAQAEMVSVDYPDIVENYRFARAVQQRSQSRQASTEDLREALLRYRSLFDELLRSEGNGAAGTIDGRPQPANSRGSQRTDAPVPDAGLTDQANGPRTEENEALADPATSDPDYHDQQLGQ
jgi:hypothetical protein